MLGEIVANCLAGIPELELVDSIAAGQDPLIEAQACKADLLIVSELDPALARVFAGQGLSILAISQDGRDAEIVRLDGERLPLDRESIRRVATFVRRGRR